MKNASWVGGVPPRLPAFAATLPPSASMTTSWHDDDTVLISVEGGPLETVRGSRFKAFLWDGKTEGHAHVCIGGVVHIASFATFRAYIFGTAGPAGHPAPEK